MSSSFSSKCKFDGCVRDRDTTIQPSEWPLWSALATFVTNLWIVRLLVRTGNLLSSWWDTVAHSLAHHITEWAERLENGAGDLADHLSRSPSWNRAAQWCEDALYAMERWYHRMSEWLSKWFPAPTPAAMQEVPAVHTTSLKCPPWCSWVLSWLLEHVIVDPLIWMVRKCIWGLDLVWPLVTSVYRILSLILYWTIKWPTDQFRVWLLLRSYPCHVRARGRGPHMMMVQTNAFSVFTPAHVVVGQLDAVSEYETETSRLKPQQTVNRLWFHSTSDVACNVKLMVWPTRDAATGQYHQLRLYPHQTVTLLLGNERLDNALIIATFVHCVPMTREEQVEYKNHSSRTTTSGEQGRQRCEELRRSMNIVPTGLPTRVSPNSSDSKEPREPHDNQHLDDDDDDFGSYRRNADVMRELPGQESKLALQFVSRFVTTD